MKKPLKVLLPAGARGRDRGGSSGRWGRRARRATPRPPPPATTKCVKYAGVESSGNKNSMDPAQQPSSQSSLNVNASYDRLTTEDDNWKVLPQLATSWKSNTAGTVWTFQLRKNVKFWDGKPLHLG